MEIKNCVRSVCVMNQLLCNYSAYQNKGTIYKWAQSLLVCHNYVFCWISLRRTMLRHWSSQVNFTVINRNASISISSNLGELFDVCAASWVLERGQRSCLFLSLDIPPLTSLCNKIHPSFFNFLLFQKTFKISNFKVI
jgi:hypothetical protein